MAIRGILRWILHWPEMPVPASDHEYGVWIPHEQREPTGNEYVRPPETGAPEGNDNSGPFGPWRSGGK